MQVLEHKCSCIERSPCLNQKYSSTLYEPLCFLLTPVIPVNISALPFHHIFFISFVHRSKIWQAHTIVLSCFYCSRFAGQEIMFCSMLAYFIWFQTILTTLHFELVTFYLKSSSTIPKILLLYPCSTSICILNAIVIPLKAFIVNAFLQNISINLSIVKSLQCSCHKWVPNNIRNCCLYLFSVNLEVSDQFKFLSSTSITYSSSSSIFIVAHIWNTSHFPFLYLSMLWFSLFPISCFPCPLFSS